MRLAMVLLAVALAGCGAAPATQPPTNLGVDNGTTVTVSLFVNGNRITDVAPGNVESVVSGTALPPLPWTVETRSPSGRVLGTLLAGPYTANTTFGSEFDLTCGIIRVWTGDSEPPVAEPSGSAPYPCGP